MDAKTSNRFIRYALQQLMKDHANAAQRLCVMEERLSAEQPLAQLITTRLLPQLFVVRQLVTNESVQ